MFTINKTFSLKKSEINKDWWIVDAEDLVLGRLASRIAIMLKGKHKPTYTPHMDCGDNIIVVNSSKILLTGKKLKDKIYYRHTGYPGGVKTTTPEHIMRKNKSDFLLKMAVKRMIGKGPLAYKQLTNLYIYPNADHKHEAQQPKVWDVASLNSKNKVRRSVK